MKISKLLRYFGIKKPRHIVFEEKSKGIYALSKPLMSFSFKGRKEKGVLIVDSNGNITPTFSALFGNYISRHAIAVNKDVVDALIKQKKAFINANEELLAVKYKGIVLFICKKEGEYYIPITEVR